MKTKVITLILTFCLIFSTFIYPYADSISTSSISQNNVTRFTLKDENNKDVDIEMYEKNNIVFVDVYVEGKLDHKTKTNKLTGEIILTNSIGEETRNQVKDYLNNEKQSMKNYKNIPDNTNNVQNIIPDDGGGYGDGYSYVENHFSLDYQITGYLYSKYLGSQGRQMEKRFNFTAGTAIGVVIGVLSTFITGGVTISIILWAAGSSVVGGVLGSYVDSSICFDYLRTLYRVRVNGVIGLDTYIDQRMEVVYDYVNQKETFINAGLGGGFAGSNYDMIETGCMFYRYTYGY